MPQGMLPELRWTTARLRGHRWHVCFADYLAEFLLDGDGLTADVHAALLDELAVVGDRPYRAQVDAGSLLVAVVVHPGTSTLHLGSPHFATEALLDAVLEAENPGFSQHAGAWQLADPSARPMDIARITVRHGLTDIRDAAPGTPLAQVHDRARQMAIALVDAMATYQPPLLERISQVGLGLQADYAVLRVHALRFVAMLPSVDHDDTGEEVQRLAVEMLRRAHEDSRAARAVGKHGEHGPLPEWLEAACALGGWAAGRLPAALVANATRAVVKKLAGIFIAGETIEVAQPALEKLESTGRSATLDQLGELVISEHEADAYQSMVLELVTGTGQRHSGRRNKAGVPVAHVSVKVSALCAHYEPDDPEGTWKHVGPRLQAIFRAAQEAGVFIQLDAEHYAVRDLTFQMMARALRSDPALWSWPDVGIVVQAYLTDAPAHLEAVLSLCRERGTKMPLRLVKGAYWDEETTEARAHGWDAPQFLNKAETDACFQQLCLRVLAAGDVAQLCIGSHNLRDHCFSRAARELLYPDAPPIEHQALHRTYEALSTGMAKLGWAVRNYIPVGSLLVGMAYLVRRVMENSSQVGVLTMAREGVDLPTTLKSPVETIQRASIQRAIGRRPATESPDFREFRNVAPARLHMPAHRDAFDKAIAFVQRQQVEATSRQDRSGPIADVRSPSDGAVIGAIQLASRDDVPTAITRLRNGWREWRSCPVGARAAVLAKAGELMRGRRLQLAALVALEAGKARREALADIDEAIDFLQFYAREALRREAGEHTLRSRGVIAVIAPWNFPLAIPCGMAGAALVAGNAVALKSAEQTPLIAEALVDLLHEAGAPQDALVHLPGDGLEVGAPLSRHPEVAGIVFTGSRAVGTLLHDTMATLPGVDRPDDGRLVITEMGGKNAVVVTANADLDEAISGVLYAAFGHAGQKCSAASRVLVDERVVGTFRDRLATAIADLVVGHAMSPGVQVNPVVTAEDAQRLRDAVREAAEECAAQGGEVIADRSSEFVESPGSFVGPTALLLPADAALDAGSIAQRELFGPVLHVIPFATLEQAVEVFNSTAYALTGGVYAQSEDDIDWLSERLVCGNLYINRPNTGARVAIEPFGGFRMSGTGPKAGGERYLDAFYAPAARVDAMARSPQKWWRQARAAVSRVRLASARTRLIPGQDNRNRWDVPRGDVVVLARGRQVSQHVQGHIATAAAAGNAVQVIVDGACGPEIRAFCEVGALDPAVVDANDPTALQLLRNPDVATLVCDGPVHSWQRLLERAGKVRGRSHLWAICDSQTGPLLDDDEALARCHLSVRTVVVNTMRHGAPLALND